MEKMIKRSDKKAFYGVPSESGATYTRMKHFTEISINKNPKEYARQYVDESQERTDVVGYSPAMSYSFDDFSGDTVLEDIVKITNEETLGTDAQREIIQVDFARPLDSGGYAAVKRTFAVIADSEGSGTENYTYSGTFKCVSSKIHGKAVIKTPANGDSETVETIEFTETVSE